MKWRNLKFQNVWKNFMRSFKNKRLILYVGVKLNLQHWVPPSSYSITFTIPSVAIATIQPHNQPINLCQRNHHVKACSQSAMLRYINCHQPIDYLCEGNAFHICRWHSQLLSNRDMFFFSYYIVSFSDLVVFREFMIDGQI